MTPIGFSRRIAPWLLACLCAAILAACAPPARAALSPAAQAALVEGDAAAEAFNIEGALSAYRAGVERDSTAYDLWWRLARSYTDRGARAQYDGNKEAAAQAYDAAVRAARKATALGPERPEGHLELAVALGRSALFKGGGDKIRLSKEVKAEADRVVGLDPNSDRAYHVLARWNRGIAELSFFEKTAVNVVYGGVPKGATMNNAVTLFEKAIALAPDYANHRLELGRTYLALGLEDKAKAELQRALTCPKKTSFDAEYKTEAQKLLSKLD